MELLNGRPSVRCFQQLADSMLWISDAASAGSAAGRARTERREFLASTSPRICCTAPEPKLADAAITYTRADMEHLELPASSFDLAYSSLAFHYIEDVRRLMTAIHRSLIPRGFLVFSVEHPIFMAPSEPKFSTTAAGRSVWALDGYLDEGPRITDWLAKGVVKHHRTLATWINTLVEVGFAISHVDEWGPTPEHIAAHPDWADDHQRPMFLLISARR